MWVWLVVGWMACVPAVLLLMLGDGIAQYIRHRLRVERSMALGLATHCQPRFCRV